MYPLKVYKGGPKTRLRSKPATREERVRAFLRRRVLHASAQGDAFPPVQAFIVPRRTLSFRCLRSFSCFLIGLLPSCSRKYGCTDSLQRHSRDSCFRDSHVVLHSLHDSTNDHVTNMYSVQDLWQGRKRQPSLVCSCSLTHLLTYVLTGLLPCFFTSLLTCLSACSLRCILASNFRHACVRVYTYETNQFCALHMCSGRPRLTQTCAPP